jgi:hypothetical protein
MSYLHKPLSTGSAYHLFDGTDTMCRMWSTGGFKKAKYRVTEEKPNKRLCHMCSVNLGKLQTEMEQVEHLRSIMSEV